MRTIAVIHNTRSGSSSGTGLTPERLHELLAGYGVQVETRPFEPATVGDDVRALLAGEPEALLVVGGDGTVRSVAEHLIDGDVPVGVIPTGTMNLLARDLGVPMEPEAALAAALGAPVHRIDVGMVDQQAFLCSSALAVLPHLGRVRESARHGTWVARVRWWLRGLRLWLRYPRIRMRIAVDGREYQISTTAIVVSNNPLSARPIAGRSRERLDTGVLAAYVLRGRPRLDLIGIAAGVVAGSWQDDKRVRVLQGRTLCISVGLKRLTVMHDGEVTEMATPLRYELRPRALPVLAPGTDS